MNKLTFFIAVLSIFVLSQKQFFAQTFPQVDSSKFVVGQIKIFGNEKTKDFVILDELPFSSGDTITVKDLEYAKERIYSLKLFNFVDLVTDKKNPRRIIIIVKEAWYIFPIPFLDFRKNSIKYSNYGIALLWKNFRGRNETITAALSLGFDPNFYLSYFNPNFIARKLRFSIAGGLVSVSNKSVYFRNNFSQEDFSSHSHFFTLGLGKRLALDKTLDLFFSFRRFSLDKPYAPDYFMTGTDYENSFSINLNGKIDTRNLKLNASEGYYLSVNLGYNYYFKNLSRNGKSASSPVFSFDFRNYVSTGNFGIFRARIKGSYLPNGENVSYYDRAFLGYTTYVRGHAFDKCEGYHYFLANAEYAISLIKNLRFSVDTSVLPTSLTSTRFGAELVFFFDAGKTFEDNFNVKIPYGYGVGLNLLFLPYSAVRFEFAWDEQGKWEFLFGTGFNF